MHTAHPTPATPLHPVQHACCFLQQAAQCKRGVQAWRGVVVCRFYSRPITVQAW